jgi:hypothetical protein
VRIQKKDSMKMDKLLRTKLREHILCAHHLSDRFILINLSEFLFFITAKM